MKKIEVGLIVLAVFGIFSLSIAYSAFGSDLTISGEATVAVENEVRVTGNDYVSSTNGAYEKYNSKYTNYTVSMFPVVSEDGTIVYQVTITNNTDDDYAFLGDNLISASYDIVDEEGNTISTVTDTSSVLSESLDGVEYYTKIPANSSITFDVILDISNLNLSEGEEAEFSLMIEFSWEVYEGPFTVAELIEKDLEATPEGTPSVSKTSCSSGCGEDTTGLYEAEDDDGTTYYYRGSVEDNYVYFAGFYWRIIRFNGDGTIRLIYDGTTAHENGESSTDRRIGTSAFNTSYKDNAYVGYMYGSTGASSSSAAQKNTNSSTVKTYLENWYATNLYGTDYESYIDTNAGFCGDRYGTTSSSSAPNGTGGYGTKTSYYGARYRIYSTKTPVFTCKQSNDLYTTSESSQGNQAITYPIGLITIDEVAYAGSVYNTTNSGFYLYIGTAYWTISPSYYTGTYAHMWRVETTGYLMDNGTSYTVAASLGVRPVINLKSSTILAGSGTIDSPYIVSGQIEESESDETDTEDSNEDDDETNEDDSGTGEETDTD